MTVSISSQKYVFFYRAIRSDVPRIRLVDQTYYNITTTHNYPIKHVERIKNLRRGKPII